MFKKRKELEYRVAKLEQTLEQVLGELAAELAGHGHPLPEHTHEYAQTLDAVAELIAEGGSHFAEKDHQHPVVKGVAIPGRTPQNRSKSGGSNSAADLVNIIKDADEETVRRILKEELGGKNRISVVGRAKTRLAELQGGNGATSIEVDAETAELLSDG